MAVERTLFCKKCKIYSKDDKNWGSTPCPRCGWPMEVIDRKEVE